MFSTFRPREAEDDGRPNRVRLVEGRQRPSYAAAAAFGPFGALLQDRLWDTAALLIQEYTSKCRKLNKLMASLAAFKAEVAAGRSPSSIGPGALRTHAHTGFADLDTAAEAAAAAQYTELLQRISAGYIPQKEAGITRLEDELQHIKTVAGPTALNTTFNSIVAGSAHAQDAALQELLTEFKKLLDLNLSATENKMREGNVMRESKLLAAVERRTQLQLQRQQRGQAFGVTAEALAAAAAAAGAAAVTSAVASTAAAEEAPAGDAHMAEGEGAAEGEEPPTQPMHLNQEQQQQELEAQAAARAPVTPQQLAAAIQAGFNASITHLLQHGLMPRPPSTSPQPRPRNRQPGGTGRQNGPQQQQQQPRNRPQQPQQQQQQQRNKPRKGQQQQPRRSPNGPAPRQQDQPRRNPPQQRQQQRQQPRRPNGAAGHANVNDGYRRTGNGGNRGRQARQPSH
jgi:hypothetical protein